MTSIFKFLYSFIYATNGFLHALRTQRNMRIHIIVLTLVIIFGIYFSLSQAEWLDILICSGLVLSAEMFNSAIEDICDLIRDNLKLKYAATVHARDLAAGAVLVSAVIAALVGASIFIPRFAALMF